MAYGDPQLLHLDAMLTNISVGFQNDSFVADRLAPAVQVEKQSNKYFVFTRQPGFAFVMDDLRTPGARAKEMPQMTLSRDSYFAEEHSLVDVVPIEEQQNADPGVDPAADAATRLSNTILLVRESKLVTLATTAANYASGFSTTLSGANQWDQYSTSTPISDMKTGRSKIHDNLFQDPNTVIMGYQVAVKLEDHPSFINRIVYSGIGKTSDQIIADLMGVPNFVRAGAGKLTNVPGQAETFSYLWGKDVVLAYVPDAPGRRQPAFMYEFVWNYGGGADMPTERWFDMDRKSDILRVSRRYALKFIVVDGSAKSNGPGYLIKSAVS